MPCWVKDAMAGMGGQTGAERSGEGPGLKPGPCGAYWCPGLKFGPISEARAKAMGKGGTGNGKMRGSFAALRMTNFRRGYAGTEVPAYLRNKFFSSV